MHPKNIVQIKSQNEKIKKRKEHKKLIYILNSKHNLSHFYLMGSREKCELQKHIIALQR
jgi:hypothetical protein